MDHGSLSLATSKIQMQMLKEAAIDTVVATPHFYPHREGKVSQFLERRQRAAERLTAALPEGQGYPSLCLGAEVLLFPGLEQLDSLQELAIAGTDVILIEMPHHAWSDRLLYSLEAITRGGLRPLMAHLDRYWGQNLNALFEMSPLLFQANAAGLCRLSTRRFFREMAEHGQLAAIGSDLHGVKKTAYRQMKRALRYLGAQTAEELRLQSQRLLCGARRLQASGAAEE